MESVKQDQLRCKFSIDRNIFNLQKELKCPLCLNFMTKPKLTTCNHAFCENCLEEFVENNKDENFPPCPLCRRPLRIPEEEVRSIRTETNYEMIIQHIEGKAILSSEEIQILRSTLNCRQCDKSCDNLKRITCGHIFCFQCLSEHHNKTPSRELILSCPICSKASEIPENGLLGFDMDPSFFNIVKELTVISLGSGQSANAKCEGTCDSIKIIATKCESCQKIFCKDCAKIHSFYKPDSVTFEVVSNSQIDAEPIKETFLYPSRLETDHSHEGLDHYCDECDEPICMDCKGLDHFSHHKSYFEELEHDYKRWVQNTCSELESFEKRLQENKQSLEINDKNFRRECMEIKQTVKQTIQSLIKQLIEKEKEFLEEFEGATKPIQDRLKTEIKRQEHLLLEMRSQMNLVRDCSDCRYSKGIHMLKRLTTDLMKNKKMHMQHKRYDLELTFEKGITDTLSRAIENLHIGDYHTKQNLQQKNLVSEEINRLNTIFHEDSVFDTDALTVAARDLPTGEKRYVTTIKHRHSSEYSDSSNTTDKEQKDVLGVEFNQEFDSVKILKIQRKTIMCKILSSDGTLILDKVIAEETADNTINVWHLTIDSERNAIVGLQSSTGGKTLRLHSGDGKRTEQLKLPYEADELETIGKIRACDNGILCVSLNNRYEYFDYLS